MGATDEIVRASLWREIGPEGALACEAAALAAFEEGAAAPVARSRAAMASSDEGAGNRRSISRDPLQHQNIAVIGLFSVILAIIPAVLVTEILTRKPSGWVLSMRVVDAAK